MPPRGFCGSKPTMVKTMSSNDIQALPYRPCVGVMLINSQGDIWAGKRIDNPGNAWQMPQGGVDEGEAAQAAAFRELEEETAVPRDVVELLARTTEPVRYDLPEDLIPKLWGGRYRGQEQFWFLMRLTGPDELVNIETAEPEFSEWQWMPFAELMKFVVPFKAHVYEAAWKEFGSIVGQTHA